MWFFFLGTCILMCRAWTFIVQIFTVIYHTLFPIMLYMYYMNIVCRLLIKEINYVALEVEFFFFMAEMSRYIIGIYVLIQI